MIPGSAFPSIVAASGVIQRLRSCRIQSAREAVGQLAVWQESSRILALYRCYFSQQFSCSMASTQIPIHHREPGYSERELEFFTLVDAHLFPLPDVMFDTERLPSIPIYPQGVDWEEERDTMRLSLRAAMALVTDDDAMVWEPWLPKELRALSGERDWDQFAELCRKAKGLAARFPLLLELVGLDTDNLWLDTTWEMGWAEFPWEETAMDYLRKEWRKAQHLFGQLNPLLDAIDKHPRYWLKRLVKLWNAAIKVPAKAGSKNESTESE